MKTLLSLSATLLFLASPAGAQAREEASQCVTECGSASYFHACDTPVDCREHGVEDDEREANECYTICWNIDTVCGPHECNGANTDCCPAKDEAALEAEPAPAPAMRSIDCDEAGRAAGRECSTLCDCGRIWHACNYHPSCDYWCNELYPDDGACYEVVDPSAEPSKQPDEYCANECGCGTFYALCGEDLDCRDYCGDAVERSNSCYTLCPDASQMCGPHACDGEGHDECCTDTALEAKRVAQPKQPIAEQPELKAVSCAEAESMARRSGWCSKPCECGRIYYRCGGTEPDCGYWCDHLPAENKSRTCFVPIEEKANLRR